MGSKVGIICEFDPFHRGHKRLIDEVKSAIPDCRVVCAMSGAMTQRGEAALFAPGTRAEMALLGGADAVVEIPCAFSVRDAERFALGGVSILSRLGCDTLAFGCESGDIRALESAAAVMESEPERVFEGMKPALKRGESYARAQGQALSEILGEDAHTKPNDVLALCYLRAIRRLRANMKPFCVKREGDYHELTLTMGYPSARAVRAAALGGETLSGAIPSESLPPLMRDISEGKLCRPDALDRVLIYKLRASEASTLNALPDCSEGLGQRIAAMCREHASREGLLTALKTKRYTYARLSRLLCHALLDITGELLDGIPLPPYARLLGFRAQSEGLLKEISEGDIPLIAKAADMDRSAPCARLDERAYDMWSLGANQPAGLMYTQGVTVIQKRS